MRFIGLMKKRILPGGGSQLAATVPFIDQMNKTTCRVNWTAVSNATNYIVERAQAYDDGTELEGRPQTYTQVYSGSALTLNQTGLSSITTYFWRVKAQASGYTDSDWAIQHATTYNTGNILVLNNGGGLILSGDPTSGYYYPIGDQPGDTVVLTNPAPGNPPWAYIYLQGYKGTAGNKILFVTKGDMGAGPAFVDFEYVKITGAGSEKTRFHGFHIQGPGAANSGGVSSPAINLIGVNKHVTIDTFEAFDWAYAIYIKNEIAYNESDADCGASKWWPNHMDDIHMYDVYGHDCWQDMVYCGSSDPYGLTRPINCHGTTITPRPTGMKNIVIHHNTLINSGRSLIQWGGSDEGTNKIYSNYLKWAGFEQSSDQGAGIALGSASQGIEIYDNHIEGTWREALYSYHYGHLNVHDNTFINTGTTPWGSLPYGMRHMMVNPYNAINPGPTKVTIKNNVFGTNTDTTCLAFLDSNNTYDTGNNCISGNTYKGVPLISGDIFIAPGATSFNYSTSC